MLVRSDTPAAFTAWLARVVRSQVARQIRANRKRNTVFGGGIDELDRPFGPGDDLDRLDDREFVAKALARLKRETSQLNYGIFHMRMIEELSVQEVADRLDLSRQQVWYRQHRAMSALCAIIEALVR